MPKIATDEQVEQRAKNVAHLERTYGGFLVGSDLPDTVMFESGPDIIDELVKLSSVIDTSPLSAWKWLREDLTDAEALAWLGDAS